MSESIRDAMNNKVTVVTLVLNNPDAGNAAILVLQCTYEVDIDFNRASKIVERAKRSTNNRAEVARFTNTPEALTVQETLERGRGKLIKNKMPGARGFQIVLGS